MLVRNPRGEMKSKLFFNSIRVVLEQIFIRDYRYTKTASLFCQLWLTSQIAEYFLVFFAVSNVFEICLHANDVLWVLFCTLYLICKLCFISVTFPVTFFWVLLLMVVDFF